MKILKSLLSRAGAVFILPALLATSLLPGTGGNASPIRLSNPAAGDSSLPALTTGIKHIFIVMMENKGYSQVWDTSSTPYITQLGRSYARATAFHAIRHPSLPNYLDLIGGSNYGITTDCNPSSSCHVNAYQLSHSLQARGLTFKSYLESMPSPCYMQTSGNYAPKHNPQIYFDGTRLYPSYCRSVNVPFSVFSTDLARASTTPTVSLISPNQCNDMHSCSISTGDNWLRNHIPAILNSPACTSDKCLVVVTWDEDNGNYGNRVLTIFAGSAAKTSGVASSTSYNHFSLLKTVEYIFGLPALTSNDRDARPMLDMVR